MGNSFPKIQLSLINYVAKITHHHFCPVSRPGSGIASLPGSSPHCPFLWDLKGHICPMSRPDSGIASLPGSNPHCPFLPATGRGWVFLHSCSLTTLLRELSWFCLPHPGLGRTCWCPARLMIGICAKKCYHSRPDFKGPAYKVVPWLASGNLIFRRVPTIPRTDKGSSLCLICLYKQCGFC